MCRRVLVNVALFEAVLIVVIGHHWDIFYDIQGAAFNVGLVLWLSMESARVRLGHKTDVITVGKFSRMFLVVSIATVLLAAWEHAHRDSSFTPALPAAAVYVGGLLFVLGVYLRYLSIPQRSFKRTQICSMNRTLSVRSTLCRAGRNETVRRRPAPRVGRGLGDLGFRRHAATDLGGAGSRIGRVLGSRGCGTGTA